jgi:hypothetical protein
MDALHIWWKRFALGHGRLMSQGAHEGWIHLALVRRLLHHASRGEAGPLLHQVPRLRRPRSVQLVQGAVLIKHKYRIESFGGAFLKLSRSPPLLHQLPDLVFGGVVRSLHKLHGHFVDYGSFLRTQPSQGFDLEDGRLPRLLWHLHRELSLIWSILNHAWAGYPHAHLRRLLGNARNLHLVRHEPMLRALTQRAPRSHLVQQHLLPLLLGRQLGLPRGSIIVDLVLEVGNVTLPSLHQLRVPCGHGMVI